MEAYPRRAEVVAVPVDVGSEASLSFPVADDDDKGGGDDRKPLHGHDAAIFRGSAASCLIFAHDTADVAYASDEVRRDAPSPSFGSLKRFVGLIVASRVDLHLRGVRVPECV